MSRLRSRLALALLSLLVSLAAVEIFLRLAAPVTYRAPLERRRDPWRTLAHRASKVPGLIYELAPSVRVETDRGLVETNRFGMRDRERELVAAPGTLRIAVLGDSFTFGFGVAAHEAYPAQLERCLNERAAPGQSVEVLNFGVGGYSTRDEAVALAEKVAPFSPQRILVGYVLNDPEIDPIQPLHAYFTPPALWQRFHLGRLVAQAANRRAIARYGGGNYTRYLHAEPRKWGSVLAGFDRMKTLGEERGFEVTVAIFPLIPPERWESYPYREIHAQVGKAAEARGFGLVDLLPALSVAKPESIWVSPEDRHPNAHGHALAARAICDKMLSLGR